MSSLSIALHALRACAAEGSATAAAGLALVELGDGARVSLPEIAERCGRSVDSARRQLRSSGAFEHRSPSRPGRGRKGTLHALGLVLVKGGKSATPSPAGVVGSSEPQRGSSSRGGSGGWNRKVSRAWSEPEAPDRARRAWAASLGRKVHRELSLRHPEVRRPCQRSDFAAASLGLLELYGDAYSVERWWHAATAAGAGGKAHPTGHYLLRDPLDYASRTSIVNAVERGWGVSPADRMRPPGDVRARPCIYSPAPGGNQVAEPEPEPPDSMDCAPVRPLPFPPFPPEMLSKLESLPDLHPGAVAALWATAGGQERVSRWARSLLPADLYRAWADACSLVAA